MSTTERFHDGWENKYRDQKEGPAWSSEPQPGVKEFLGRLSPGSLVLDVGSGDGRNSAFAIEAGHHAVMLDVAPTALDLALRNMRGAERPPLAVLSAMEEMPLAGGQFDAVICLDALPQVSNCHRALREMHRVLRPAGALYVNVFTPRDCAWGEGEQVGPRSWVYKNTLFSFFEAGELESMCGGLFAVTESRHCNWMDPPHVPFRPYPHQHDAIFATLTRL